MPAMEKEKPKYKELVEEAQVLLAEIQNSELTRDPMRGCAALYILKATFERSASPNLAEELYKLDILSTLTGILSREYDPKDQTNKRLLYLLAADILHQLSWISTKSQVETFYKENIVNALCNFIDTAGDFFRFSPAFQNRLAELIERKPLVNQRVCPISVTKEVWADLLKECPQMRLYGAVAKIYDCHLCIMPVDDNDKEYLHYKISVAQHLINAKFAWKFSNSKMDMGPLFETLNEFLHSENRKTAEKDELLEITEKVQLSEVFEDIWVLDVIGSRYFWAYVGNGSLKMVDSFSELLAEKLPSLTLAESPQVGNLVVVENLDPTNPESNGKIRKVPSIFRGRIIAISDEQVTLFALDFGMVVTVKKCALHQLPGLVDPLLKTPYFAQVCRLSGVQATPVDEDALERSICALVNIARFHGDSGGLILRKDPQLFYPLLESAPPQIQLQVTKLLFNLSVYGKQPSTSFWKPLIRPQLSILACLSHKMDDEATYKLLIACLWLLNNVVQMKAEYRECYSDLQGNIIILNIMRNFSLSEKIVSTSVRILRSVYPNIAEVITYRQARDNDKIRSRRNSTRKSSEPTDSLAGSTSQGPLMPSSGVMLVSSLEDTKQTVRNAVQEFTPITGSEGNGYLPGEPCSPPSAAALLSSLSSSSSLLLTPEPDEDSLAPMSSPTACLQSSSSLFQLEDWPVSPEQNTGENKGFAEGRKFSRNAPTRVRAAKKTVAGMQQRVVTSSSSSTDCEGNSDSSLLLDNNDSFYPDYDVSSTDSETLLPVKKSMETTADVEHITPVDFVKAYEEKSVRNVNAKYIYDSYLDIRDGPNCHLLYFQDVKLVRTITISELICAFMNASGGTIYMGIDKQGCVKGVRLNRAERDSVRLSLDKMMSSANPPFLHNQIQLVHQPVYQQMGPDTLPCTDLWVIEITMRAPTEFQCYSIMDKSLGKHLCYMRFGHSNHLMKENDIRELVVCEAERTYLKELASLEQRLQELDGQIKMLEEKNQ